MKKKIKIGCGVLAGCIVLTTGAVVAIKVIQSKNDNNEQNIFFEDEDDKKLKEDISNDVPDKNPEEIVIPRIPTKEEGATDEEIAEAQKKADAAKQEKEYWTVVQTVKQQLKEKILESAVSNPDGDMPTYIKNFQSIRRINNFYYSDQDGIIVDTDILYSDNDKLKQMKMIYSFKNSEMSCDTESLTNMMDFIMNIKTESQIITSFNDYNYSSGLNEFYENHIKNKYLLKEYQDDGYSVELIDLKCSTTDGKIPTTFFCVSKLTKNDNVFYLAHQLNTYSVTSNMSEEEWLGFVKTTNNKGFSVQLETEWSPTKVDWKALSEEYSGQKTQEAQAQAIIDNFSTFDENGDLETFDYPAYQEYCKQKEAEKEAKELEQNMTQKARVTYTEQELGF